MGRIWPGQMQYPEIIAPASGQGADHPWENTIMKTYMTPEEHDRLHRRRWRQLLGFAVAVLALVGAFTVLRLSLIHI